MWKRRLLVALIEIVVLSIIPVQIIISPAGSLTTFGVLEILKFFASRAGDGFYHMVEADFEQRLATIE